ncbi:MAG: hypothetical protein Dbin4_02623 [Alphaproteobacteria bacterium]|nr:hypothetical protein [Alphaproteobacteria bacterium]
MTTLGRFEPGLRDVMGVLTELLDDSFNGSARAGRILDETAAGRENAQ